MKFKLKNPRDFWSGVIFFALGAGFAIIAKGDPFGIFPGYPIGNASRMGPGYFPFVLAAILAVLGAIIAFLSLATHSEPVEKFAVRPLIFILGAVVIFGLLVKALGIALGIVVLVMISAYGGHEFKLKEVLIMAVILAVSCVLIFVYGLKLPFPIWPSFITG
jgi:prepilin signal peptidase PulO-like enzyme (type II secretory pathway)